MCKIDITDLNSRLNSNKIHTIPWFLSSLNRRINCQFNYIEVAKEKLKFKNTIFLKVTRKIKILFIKKLGLNSYFLSTEYKTFENLSDWGITSSLWLQ